MSGRQQINAGFLPLLDSALLVAAQELGFASNEGIELQLVRENSWASIRDRLAVGHFHAAHMLAPMPIACNLGLTPLAAETIAPMALGLGGNAITVSLDVWQAMQEERAPGDLDPRQTGQALAAVSTARAQRGDPPLRFGVVHPHSGHNYELRYWLAGCGVDPERQIEILIVPPPLMADALAAGRIDGYCVGEPWNTAAVVKGVGRIVTVKAAIWKSSPEKVLGVAANWAEQNPVALAALLRALYRAAEWCGLPDNHRDVARMLSGANYLDCPPDWLMPALRGAIEVSQGEVVSVPDFFVPHAKAATFPWKSHALWFYSQMARWGQIDANSANEAIARNSYRPDLYRAALSDIGVALPGANAKVEGALTKATPVGSAGASLILGPDGFFDGAVFDPDQVAGYLVAQHRK